MSRSVPSFNMRGQVKRGEVIVDREDFKREAGRTPDGMVRISQIFDFERHEAGRDVSGRFWVFAFVKMLRGTVSYNVDQSLISISDSFCIFIPPFEITEPTLQGVKSHSWSLSSDQPLGESAPRHAIVFDPPDLPFPTSLPELKIYLSARNNVRQVSRNSKPCAVARKIKTLLDEHYSKNLLVGDISKGLKIPGNQVTKYFKDDFGLAPVKYRQWLRSMDAMHQLMENRPIVDVSDGVGYGDLSRFYKQFKEIKSASPHKYQNKR